MRQVAEVERLIINEDEDVPKMLQFLNNCTRTVKEDALSEFIGCDEAKAVIQERIGDELYAHLSHGADPAKGLLLFGPAGTGKTFLAQAAASALGFFFFNVAATSLKGSYVGQCDRYTYLLFKMATIIYPSAIYIDELDALAPDRDDRNSSSSHSAEFVGGMLPLVEGFDTLNSTKPFLIASTNRLETIDKALMSRFSAVVHVPLPDKDGCLLFVENVRKNLEVRLYLTDDEALEVRVIWHVSPYIYLRSLIYISLVRRARLFSHNKAPPTRLPLSSDRAGTRRVVWTRYQNCHLPRHKASEADSDGG